MDGDPGTDGIARPKEQREKLAPGARRSGHERDLVIIFATILVMLAAAVLLLAIARRLRLPYPALLALAGAAVAIAPVDVGLHLDPELALALFIAPRVAGCRLRYVASRPEAPLGTGRQS